MARKAPVKDPHRPHIETPPGKTAPEGAQAGDADDATSIEESIEVSGVALVVWLARLSLYLFVQGVIVLASYAHFGFDTDPHVFGPGFQLDPIHASINLVWGLVGSVIGFFMPRYAIDFVLAFAFFYTALAGFGTFTDYHFGMQLDRIDNLANWALALVAWAAGIYALWQDCVHADPSDPTQA